MRILFTGASSFTGYWFVRKLSEAGHQVVATFRRPLDGYEGVRKERVWQLAAYCEQVPICTFGDETCLELIRSRDWDVLCHHAADATDYKSRDFDASRALANNTCNLRSVLAGLRARGCRRIVLTGSVFERGEGAGSEGLPAFSPYGLSKTLTAECFRYYSSAHGFRLGKFVISNPFGPFEEPRFTAYLVRSWYVGQVATVNTPDYIRDNIHVSLLAKVYADFVERLESSVGFQRVNPSGYVGSQGSFAQLFANSLREGLGLPCRLDLKKQTAFDEPRIRINTDVLDSAAFDWDEDKAWAELASYYRSTYGSVAESEDDR
jgi:UDP-glucose 4-epimerase